MVARKLKKERKIRTCITIHPKKLEEYKKFCYITRLNLSNLIEISLNRYIDIYCEQEKENGNILFDDIDLKNL